MLSSIVGTQIAAHAPYGGVVPEIAARSHVETIDGIVAQALKTAGVGYGDLSGVAATAGPGLVGGVMVGLSFGKAVALARGLPLVAVNHLEGHAVSARLAADIPYPFLLLLVSGGHCQLLAVEGVGACRRLGSTIDDAAGEAFDKIAKSMGLPYPGGPALEKLAEGGDPSGYDLPRALLGRAGLRLLVLGPEDRRRARWPRDRQDRGRAHEPRRRRPVRHRPPAVRAHGQGHGGLRRWSHRRRRRCASWSPAAWRPTRPVRAALRETLPPRTASPSTPRRWPTAPTTPP